MNNTPTVICLAFMPAMPSYDTLGYSQLLVITSNISIRWSLVVGTLNVRRPRYLFVSLRARLPEEWKEQDSHTYVDVVYLRTPSTYTHGPYRGVLLDGLRVTGEVQTSESS